MRVCFHSRGGPQGPKERSNAAEPAAFDPAQDTSPRVDKGKFRAWGSVPWACDLLQAL